MRKHKTVDCTLCLGNPRISMALILTHPFFLITSVCTEPALSTPGEVNQGFLHMQMLTAHTEVAEAPGYRGHVPP